MWHAQFTRNIGSFLPMTMPTAKSSSNLFWTPAPRNWKRFYRWRTEAVGETSSSMIWPVSVSQRLPRVSLLLRLFSQRGYHITRVQSGKTWSKKANRPQTPSSRGSDEMIPVRNWGRLLFVAVALLLGWAGSHSRLLQANAANRDSIQYWATGRMLVEHRSPFDLDEVLKLQQSQGYQADRGLVSRIPPWTIPVMLPFGLLNPYWTWFLIVTFSAAALVASTRLGWALFGNNETRASDCYLSSYLFAPVLACFKTGQIDLFI